MDDMNTAFEAYRLGHLGLSKPKKPDDEESVIHQQARCWDAWHAFKAGWEAAKNGKID